MKFIDGLKTTFTATFKDCYNEEDDQNIQDTQDNNQENENDVALFCTVYFKNFESKNKKFKIVNKKYTTTNLVNAPPMVIVEALIKQFRRRLYYLSKINSNDERRTEYSVDLENRFKELEQIIPAPVSKEFTFKNHYDESEYKRVIETEPLVDDLLELTKRKLNNNNNQKERNHKQFLDKRLRKN